MSEAPEQDQKTEAPTEKRLRDAAKKGEILRSRELTIAAVMLGGAVYLALAGSWLLTSLAEVLRTGLAAVAGGGSDFQPALAIWRLVSLVAWPLAGLFAVCIIAALASQAVLGSLRFNASLFAPKLNRLNPVNYFKRTFGIQGVSELGKSLLKVVLVGAIGGWGLSRYAQSIASLGAADINSAMAHTGHLAVLLLLLLSGALALVAGLDVPLQAFQLLRKLRMSRQEVKDELKQSEGSPEVKMALRRRQREMIRNNVRAAMATANVVMTNPTHFAVALRYDRAKDRAPVVVAKGKDLTAEVIRELADDHGVPVLEYPVLARALFFTSKVGQEIRDDLYVAVASILAFVFSVDRDRLVRPEVDVPPGARFDEFGRPA